MFNFLMDGVADKGLVHHLLNEYMSISPPLFFNKGAVLRVSQLTQARNRIYGLVKDFF